MHRILSFPIFEKKEIGIIEDDDIKLLLPELPFYGISGTIYRIEEAPECYYKVIYNQDGTINPNKLPISKNKGKNLKLLIDDYYKEIKNYLDKYEEQYTKYKETKYNPRLTNKTFVLLTIVTSLASIASIPFLLTTSWIGLIFETFSVLSLYIVCDIRKKDIETIKHRKNFNEQYLKLKQNLTNKTLGKEISNEKNIEEEFIKLNQITKPNSKIFPNIKILTKDKMKEVA